MIQLFLLLAIICLPIGILVMLARDIKRNWNLPKAERQRSAKKFVIAGAVLWLLLKISGSYSARENHEAGMQRASGIFIQAITLMGQSSELTECKRKVEAGEYKSHLLAYTNCQEPFMIAAYKKAGVHSKWALQSISNTWQEMMIKSDKGEVISKEEFGTRIVDIIRRDELEP
jgi:hypothetical protein